MSYNPVATYLQEADDLLAQIEHAALSLEAGAASGETINALFRAFHTLKGSGAMCGLDAVAAFTHHVENLLDRVRTGAIAVTPALASITLKASDHIRTLLAVEHGAPPPPPQAADLLLTAIEELAAGAPLSSGSAPEPVPPQPGPDAQHTWSILFQPNATILSNGGNPAALFRELRELGSCTITAHTGEVPGLDTIQPDLCYLWWSIVLQSPCDENAIRDVFIFVEDDSRLEIARIPAPPATLQCPGVDGADFPAAQPTPPEPDETPQDAASQAVAPPVPNTAPRQALSREASVRVPSCRLDRLVNLVGELVMNQSRLSQAACATGVSEFANPVQELERLVAELRDNVLGIRMLPIGTLFARFPRLVHDLSRELEKDVVLVTEGAETELDKSILDQLGDPLVHCLRNALDHAIESPEQRAAMGKPRRATIRLSAVHTGSAVTVSVRDDGRGIDRAAVRAKAIERQLIAPDASLSDKDIFNLILMPGFSTARQVTSVSGRGVGMDAVRRQIDALRGTLSIDSEEGRGTVVSITLPLTLAIIEGLLVEIGGDQFIVPMSVVTENVELLTADKQRNNGRNLIAVRGDLVPYIDLRLAFDIAGAPPPIEKVVIVQYEDHRIGMVVDRVLGTHQTVIQSLGTFLKDINVVSGATILGDGRVALILDVAAVVRHTERERVDPLAGDLWTSPGTAATAFRPTP
jgi:two-component system chemotaxis sensor kinase CheA